MDILYETSEDPFAHEPVRHKALRVHSAQSMNAETPAHLLTNDYLTPNSLFYIRHHHPVPFLTTDQVQNYRLEIDLSGALGTHTFSLEEMKQMPRTDVVATLQCSGNRRSGFNKFQKTSGTGWGQGAISTAKWTGVRLSYLLKRAGLDNAIEAQEKHKLHHVRMYSLDGMSASVPIEKVMNPYGDVIIAYEMNNQILPRDHGYPLRVSRARWRVEYSLQIYFLIIFNQCRLGNCARLCWNTQCQVGEPDRTVYGGGRRSMAARPKLQNSTSKCDGRE